MARTILVIGPQRTGTSMSAGILHHLGVPMGVSRITPNWEYFESNELSGLLRKVTGNWRQPFIHLIGKENEEALKQYVARQDLEHTVIWGAKTPLLALVGQHVVPLIEDLRVIVTTRDFEASVKSLVAREPDMQPDECRWIQGHAFCAMYLCREALIDLKTPVARIGFNALIDRPREVIESLVPFVFDGTGVIPKENAIERAIEFVDPHRRHHTTGHHDQMQREKEFAEDRVEPTGVPSTEEELTK